MSEDMGILEWPPSNTHNKSSHRDADKCCMETKEDTKAGSLVSSFIVRSFHKITQSRVSFACRFNRDIRPLLITSYSLTGLYSSDLLTLH